MPDIHSPKSEQACFHPATLFTVTVALLWSTVLLYAGGFTTSIGAGMAFLDWPLSNGSLNPEGWTRELDQFAEHSHRLAGKVIGILSIAVAIIFQFYEKRPFVRKLAWFLFVLVVLQGLLGGLRVLLDEQNIEVESNWIAQSFAVAHALGAQAVVLTLTTLFIVSLPIWWSQLPPWRVQTSCRERWFAVGLIIFGALTILAGAITRHTYSGLAIPTFPAANPEGGWIPSFWNFQIAVHFIHRTLGVFFAIAVVVYCLRLLSRRPAGLIMMSLSLLPVVLTAIQIWLGILILQTHRNPHAATLHMLNGAFLLASLQALLCLYWHPASARQQRGSASPI